MNKKVYELIFIISLTKNTEEVKNDIHEILEDYGVEILDKESKETSTRKLAYPIKKEQSAYYYVLLVKMDGNNNHKIASDINLNESILRYLFFFKDLEKIERMKKREEDRLTKLREKREKREKMLQDQAENEEIFNQNLQSDSKVKIDSSIVKE